MRSIIENIIPFISKELQKHLDDNLDENSGAESDQGWTQVRTQDQVQGQSANLEQGSSSRQRPQSGLDKYRGLGAIPIVTYQDERVTEPYIYLKLKDSKCIQSLANVRREFVFELSFVDDDSSPSAILEFEEVLGSILAKMPICMNENCYNIQVEPAKLARNSDLWRLSYDIKILAL